MTDIDTPDELASPATGLFETATDQDAVARAVAAAAPVTVERVDLAMVSSLAPALRAPIFGLLSTVADNKYVLGRRYAEWCTGAPMLESAVAAAAMAQDELGHARSFYPLLRGFPSQHTNGREAPQMEDRGWQQRATSAMTCLDRPFLSWAEFIAANVVIDAALTTLLNSALTSPYEPLRQRAAKIVQEEIDHQVHGAGWLPRIAPAELAPALERVWDDAFTWLGAADDPLITPLVSAGLVADRSDALRDRLRAQLQAALPPQLANRLLARELPWSRWDPFARRLRSATV